MRDRDKTGEAQATEPRLNIEEARYWLAGEARQMDFAKENGRFWVEPDQVKAWSTITAAAIREVLRAAGLSDDWHLNQGDADGVPSSSAD